MLDVIEKLKPVLKETFGLDAEDTDSEAFVASFIAGLFLTHRRMASISQEGEEIENIMIEDLWPDLDDFAQVLSAVEELMAEDADALDGDATGSQHRMEAIAERARVAEEREARRQAKQEAALAKQREEQRVEPVVDPAANDMSEHDWLVE